MNQFANFIKYMTQFPVIYIGYVIQTSNVPFEEHYLVIVWFIAVLINSCFTFIWDVKFDWGLGESNHGYLRGRLLFPKYIYWIAIGIDFTIRFFWLINSLFTHWDIWHKQVALTLECLELFRRWIWVFLRIEKELVQRASYLGQRDKYGI